MQIRAIRGTIIVLPETTEHLRAHPEMLENGCALLREAIGKIALPCGGLLETEIEMGRIVGKTTRVPALKIRWDEPATFAQRIGRENHSRVVLDAKPRDCSTIVVIAEPAETPGKYSLVTAWVGTLALREPWDPGIRDDKEFYAALGFWCREALVHDPRLMGAPIISTWKEVIEK